MTVTAVIYSYITEFITRNVTLAFQHMEVFCYKGFVLGKRSIDILRSGIICGAVQVFLFCCSFLLMDVNIHERSGQSNGCHSLTHSLPPSLFLFYFFSISSSLGSSPGWEHSFVLGRDTLLSQCLSIPSGV